MTRFYKLLVSAGLVGVAGLVVGCATRQSPPASVTTGYLLLKTPKVGISDQAILEKRKDKITLIVYKELKPYKVVITPSQICLNGRCEGRARILKKLGLEGYPPETLNLILDQKPLPFLPPPRFTTDGFSQRGEGITYKVIFDKLISLKDKKRKIVVIFRTFGK
jgi:hypothetical protein